MFLRFLAFILLTLVTQIGGVALVISWLLVKLFRSRLGRTAGGRLLPLGMFVLTYAIMSVAFVPAFAALGGRVPLSCNFVSSRNYAPANPLFCILNRHYTTPRLRDMLESLASHMDEAYPGTKTLYLDANFPFFDRFPLLPHLSHADGRKLDLAFYYEGEAGDYLPGAVRSPIGYWAFEQPPAGEARCQGKRAGGLRWDMDWLQPLWPDLRLDEQRTRAAVEWLTSKGRAYGAQKLFLEPHLTRRLGLSSPLLRFQGCRAARHDDHIHVQIEP